MVVHNLPIVVIACRVFETILACLLPKSLAEQITFLDYGLHTIPKDLTVALQAEIDQIETPSLIILGYGLCGNGLRGIKSGAHTLLIPRTDDCIAILLGSYQSYLEVFTSEPGTYYLTKGWLEAGSNPLQEYRGYVEKYGREKADMVMDMQYQHYTRLMFVAHNQHDIDQYREQALEIAEFCSRWGMRYEERVGSEAFIHQFIALAAEIQQDGSLNLTSDKFENFVVIQPQSEIEQRMFMR